MTRLTEDDAGQRASSFPGDSSADLPEPDIRPWPGWARVVIIIGATAILWLTIWAVV